MIRMKTGLLGGTFDPIHAGHIHIAEAAMMEYGLQEVWFMPAGDPYFKKGMGVTPPELRLEMVKRCADELPDGFSCSDIEINDKNRTYTSETLKKLNAMYPEREFYFILGLDSLISISTWHCPAEIFKRAVILCASRDSGDDFSKAHEIIRDTVSVFYEVQPDIRLIHTPEMNISSTMIRKLISEGGDASPYLTRGTYEFIRENGLYGSH